ncbi:MAG TPA: NPCBM/NEW2 domain-containing protein [Chloroflexia bacterium]|nr:NPCBM/NEW2 domain-containing protein [Chloroflexia bacterium]
MRRYLPVLLAALTLLCAWLALGLPGAFTAKASTSHAGPLTALDLAGYAAEAGPGPNLDAAPRSPERGSPLSPEATDPPILPPGFVQVPLATGLTYPTSFAFAPDGRVFIAEKGGMVRVLKAGGVLVAPVLDLSAQVNTYWDRGMMTVAVDPDFETNKYIYVYYTYEPDPNADLESDAYKGPKTNKLARYTLQGDVALTATEKILLGSVAGTVAVQSCNNYPAGSDCIPSDGPSHIGGTIRFAPDGSLFLSTGDAADFANINDNALRVQSLNSLAGKLLRIDRDTGQGFLDNPFSSGNVNAIQSKVWAYGLRNPFRFNFRPDTTVPYVGDVGMDAWEELDVVKPGLNYGWPCYEGPAPHPGYAAKPLCGQLQASAVQTPLLSLKHSAGNWCAVGGTFYTGTTYPAQYQGAYFFADCVYRYIDYLLVDANNNLVSGPHRFGYLRYNVSEFAAGGPTQLEMGADGNLYILETVFGTLSRIEVDDPKAPPQGTTYVSDLAWTSVTNGYGVLERDRSNGGSTPFDGQTITLNTVTYSKGVGVHANSDIKLYLGKSCTNFTSDVGVDDEVGAYGSITFEVLADGGSLFQSGIMTGSTATRNVSVDVTGKEELVLSVRNGGDNSAYDHGDWAGTRVTCKGVPAVAGTVPEDGEAGVLPGANVTVTFSKPMDASTFTGSNVVLTRQGSSTPVAATLNYNQAARTLSIDPVNDLQATSNYTVVVKGGPNAVKDQDGLGLYADVVWSFSTSSRPAPVISLPLPDLRVKVGDVVTYTGYATDAEDGPIPASALSWDVSICHGCPGQGSHTHPWQSGTGASGSFVVPDHGDNSYLVIVLTARDSDGLTASTSVEVRPQMVEITMSSVPPGLQLVYDSYQATTPFTRTAAAGSTHSLWAPSPQGGHLFEGWLDGGAQSHNVQVGVTNTTYTALFSTPVPSSTPMSTATPTPLACDVQFTDVPQGSTFYSFVRCLACGGVLGGYADGTFKPNVGITRGQLAKLVSNAAGYDEGISGQTFSDVPPGSTFYEYVERIVGRGVVGGYADGTFGPGNSATRGQIAKVLSNAAGFSDAPASPSFSDVGSSDPFYPYVERLASRGIIGGYADGTFGPGNPATRGQVAKMVANTFFPECAPPQ